MQRHSLVAAIQELRRQKHPEATVISNVYFAPLGKQHSFSVEMPVMRNGRILYYIEIGSFAKHLQAVERGKCGSKYRPGAARCARRRVSRLT